MSKNISTIKKRDIIESVSPGYQKVVTWDSVSPYNNISPYGDGNLPYQPIQTPVEEVMSKTDVVDTVQNGEFEQLVRNALKLTRIHESTHIIVAAIDTKGEANKFEQVKCAGEALGGYSYDVTHDCYYLPCCESMNLGTIPISYKASMPNSKWSQFVAMPDELIEKCLSTQQKQKLSAFRDKYKDPRYNIQFLQAIQC